MPTAEPGPQDACWGEHRLVHGDYEAVVTEPETWLCAARPGLLGPVRRGLAPRVGARAARPGRAPDGHPFEVEVTVGYRLDDAGLHTHVTGRNTSRGSAPWGTGPHPYLLADDAPGARVDAWRLELPAATVLEVTDDRLRLLGPGGGGAQVTWDARVLPWVQVHTADVPEDPAASRTALAPAT